jgi:hypothetical protein
VETGILRASPGPIMYGEDILVATLSKAAVVGKAGDVWQYHSRSDRHSKASCWGLLFDLMLGCSVLRDHAARGGIGFGINHEIVDFKQNRRKNLDLVVCTPRKGAGSTGRTFSELVDRYGIVLPAAAGKELESLPPLMEAPVGDVLVALEAKACMTAHSKARPRLYDELNSSHQTVHGSSSEALAGGLVVINFSDEFTSPERSLICPHCGERIAPVNPHRQPRDGAGVMTKVTQLPRRTKASEDGFDALAVIGIDCRNDGSPVKLVGSPPAPPAGDIFHYGQCVSRLSSLFATRFPKL